MMRAFSNFRVANRLGIAFALLLLIGGGLFAVGLTSMSSLRGELARVVDREMKKVEYAADMRDAVRYQATEVRDLILQADVNFKKKELDLMKDARKKYLNAASTLTAAVHDSAGQALLADIKTKEAGIQKDIDNVIDLSLYNKNDEAAAYVRDTLRPQQAALLGDLDKLVDYVDQRAVDAKATADAAYQRTLLIMSVAGIAALVLALVVSWFIGRSIVTPLARAAQVANEVADGNLAQEIETPSKDEAGAVLAALKRMTESLRGIVADVRLSAESVNVAAKEIATGNSDLSQRTEEQASSLEETASSMEELTSTVKQNADNSRQANQLAGNATQIAIKGGDIVGKVVITMGLIEEASQKIVDITSVIESIAFQTNILALNAAVEAARAGEQGRGFAVVASEVRNLAQRSATAAKEIKTLIDDSVAKVSDGSKLVEEAGRTMDEIVVSVKRVSDIIGDIAAASNEQSAGIEQVNRAITQMDEVTQQNAALVEEAAAASVALEEQATKLGKTVSVFKLGGDEPTSTVPPTVPSAARPAKERARPVEAPALAAVEGDWKEF